MESPIQISERELRNLLRSDHESDVALQEYFDIDETNPFNPTYKIKPDVTITSDGAPALVGAALVVRIANGLTRTKRIKKYSKIIKEQPNRVRIVAEGDSWFQHPRVQDTIDHLFNYFAIYSIGAAGDELRDMFADNEYLPALKAQRAEILLLSGGGNDLLGDFGQYLNEFSAGTDPTRLMNPLFFKKVSDMINVYEVLFTLVKQRSPGTRVFIHGYDYVIPRQGRKGKWLGKPMIKKGIADPKDWQDLMEFVIDHFNDSLIKVVDRHDNAIFVDVRGAVNESQWHDEIHPDTNGFQQVSLKFQNLI